MAKAAICLGAADVRSAGQIRVARRLGGWRRATGAARSQSAMASLSWARALRPPHARLRGGGGTTVPLRSLMLPWRECGALATPHRRRRLEPRASPHAMQAGSCARWSREWRPPPPKGGPSRTTPKQPWPPFGWVVGGAAPSAHKCGVRPCKCRATALRQWQCDLHARSPKGGPSRQSARPRP